jgi:4'-phosphopantetheinyl transferase
MTPAEVTFQISSRGKPSVDSACGISFNTSRSGGLSVIAVARSGVGVGVDVEVLRPMDDALEVADGLFTVRERQLLRAVPYEARAAAFLALWTRKESVVKAFGMGLSLALDAFDVSGVGADGVPRWHGRLGSWPFVVAQVDAPSGWVAAATIAGGRISLRRMEAATVIP